MVVCAAGGNGDIVLQDLEGRWSPGARAPPARVAAAGGRLAACRWTAVRRRRGRSSSQRRRIRTRSPVIGCFACCSSRGPRCCTSATALAAASHRPYRPACGHLPYRPLPAQLELLGQPAREPVGDAEGAVRARRVARADERTVRLRSGLYWIRAVRNVQRLDNWSSRAAAGRRRRQRRCTRALRSRQGFGVMLLSQEQVALHHPEQHGLGAAGRRRSKRVVTPAVSWCASETRSTPEKRSRRRATRS